MSMDKGTGTTAVSDAAASSAHVDRVTLRAPPFWKAEPEAWFWQLETQFALAHITSDTTKYHHVIAALDHEVVTQVISFMRSPPTSDKYEAIKQKLITLYTDSKEKKLKRLLSQAELGDKKPSHLLNEMMRLGSVSEPSDWLRTLWLQKLPQSVQAILTTSNIPLDELANLADRIAEIEQPHVLEAKRTSQDSSTNAIVEAIQHLSRQIEELKVRRRPRSRSKTPNRGPSETGHCWYHSTFKAKAKKCVQPCTYKGEN
ncbi:uncharacterized protein [Euwallacea similis]|uniref:uncharacterized protein n=1 Tax=Euwallacea similis TaxID=1736056 RepID=UPI00344D1516